MAYTPLTQTAGAKNGITGLNIFANAETPDVANGNTLPYNIRTAMVIRNNHATEYVQCIPQVQVTVPESADGAIACVDPDPIQIEAGEVHLVGPWTQNFKKSSDAKVYIDWVLEVGTIVAADVDVALVTYGA